jgi:hypothetical protein
VQHGTKIHSFFLKLVWDYGLKQVMKDKKNSFEQRKKLGTERGVLNYLLGAENGGSSLS